MFPVDLGAKVVLLPIISALKNNAHLQNSVRISYALIERDYEIIPGIVLMQERTFQREKLQSQMLILFW